MTGQQRSTQRKVGRPQSTEEDKLRRRLRAIARAHPRWGWKTAHRLLRREGWVINHSARNAFGGPKDSGAPLSAASAAG